MQRKCVAQGSDEEENTESYKSNYPSYFTSKSLVEIVVFTDYMPKYKVLVEVCYFI